MNAILNKLIREYSDNNLEGNSEVNCAMTVLLETPEWSKYYCTILGEVFPHLEKLEDPFNCYEKTGLTFEEMCKLESVFEDRVKVMVGQVPTYKSRNVVNGVEFDIQQALVRVSDYLHRLHKEEITNKVATHQ